jgi:hypothetical protein
MNQKYEQLAGDKAHQEYAIIKHYASIALVATDAMKIVKAEGSEDNEDARRAIEYVVKTIKDKHLEDFGLELEWG